MGKKRIINKHDLYRQEFFDYNKQARQDGLPQLQFKSLESYIEYREGLGQKVRKAPFKVMKSNPMSGRYIRETTQYPSLTGHGLQSSTAKKDPNKYSGDYMVGIATMHKSNIVPVGRDSNPVDYSTMRRS